MLRRTTLSVLFALVLLPAVSAWPGTAWPGTSSSAWTNRAAPTLSPSWGTHQLSPTLWTDNTGTWIGGGRGHSALPQVRWRRYEGFSWRARSLRFRNPVWQARYTSFCARHPQQWGC